MSHAAFVFLFLLTIPHVVEARASGQEAPTRQPSEGEGYADKTVLSRKSKGGLERYNVRLGRSSPLAWAHAIALS